MKKPPLPPDEKARLASLASLGILYSPAEERFDQITRLARRIFSVPISVISLVAEKCQWFKSAQGLMVPGTPREISFCGHAILKEDTMVVPDTSRDPDFADNPLVTGEPFIRFYAGHPLKYQGSNIGTFCIIDRVPRDLSASDLEMLRSLGAWAENELKITAFSEAQTQLLRELEEARRESLVDPLTKVWNRKGMEEVLYREMARARRTKANVVVMMLDVDHYKQINDRFGHLAGDIALKEVAQRIRSSLRPQDVIARYGGDEFLVFAAPCSWDTANLLANRILSRVSDGPVETGETSIDLSVTIGMAAAAATNGLDISRIIELADKALYDAKTAGRNCVEFRAFQ